jgi:hypothetical protein
MYGVESFKITDAQQAKLINNYRNTKFKLLKSIGATWYNKISRNSQLTLKYVNFKIKANNMMFSLKMV